MDSLIKSPYSIAHALNSPLLYGSCLYSVEISRRIFQDLLEKGKGPYMLRVLEWWWVAIVFKKLLRVLMPAAAAKSHNANFAAVLPRAPVMMVAAPLVAAPPARKVHYAINLFPLRHAPRLSRSQAPRLSKSEV